MKPMDKLSPQQVKERHPLVPAYVGDAAFLLYVRNRLAVQNDAKAGKLTELTERYVRATSQAIMLDALLPLLTEEESDVVRRARNCHSGKAKHAGLAAYRRATALEAVFGYLFLTQDFARLEELADFCMRALDEAQRPNKGETD